MNAKKMLVTTKSGPPACDVVTRTIRCAVAGKLLDTCQVQEAPDRILFRELLTPTDIVVEFVVADATRMYKTNGAGRL